MFIGNILRTSNSMNGVGRSATVVMAYLMAREGMTADQAKEYVSQRRLSISNDSFMYILYTYQQELVLGSKL